MRATGKTRKAAGAVAFLVTGTTAAFAAGCGGGDDFKNEARAPVPRELTGVIEEDKVTVSPDREHAGPISITISNQTKDAHTVTLEGESIKERVGPVNPQDTATIQKTLKRGTYEVRAGSSAAVPEEIRPARLRIGK